MAKRKAAPDAGSAWKAEQEAAVAALAVYNAECARGIVHTPEWDEKMAKRQARFDEETAAQAQWEADAFARRRRQKIGLPLSPAARAWPETPPG